jgi:molybdopterin converting factor small subunit
MRTVHQILDEIIEINQKFEALKVSIQEKETELKALKVGHKKLVIANVGQDRQPASLKVQREKILELETILEIESETIQELESKVVGLKEEKTLSEIQENLSGYAEREAEFLSKINAVKDKVSSIFDQIRELEPVVQSVLSARNPIEDLNILFGRMTYEQFKQIDIPISLDALDGFYNDAGTWRKKAQALNTLIEKTISCVGLLRHSHLNVPEPTISREVSQGQMPASSGRGVTCRLEKPEGPQGIYRNPEKYSVHDRRKFGLLRPQPKQPGVATG